MLLLLRRDCSAASARNQVGQSDSFHIKLYPDCTSNAERCHANKQGTTETDTCHQLQRFTIRHTPQVGICNRSSSCEALQEHVIPL